MTQELNAIVFDLDGTLIDSSIGILKSFELAFTQCGVMPKQPWTTALIGPPLLQTLRLQSSSNDPDLLESLRLAFVASYDSCGFRLSQPYPGVHDLLQLLRSKNIQLHIATNKRINPTRLILEYLGWSDLFDGVFGVDSFEVKQMHKSNVIRHIVSNFDLAPMRSIYVGDRFEDYESARAAGLPFALAKWGFGEAECLVPEETIRLDRVDSLRGLIEDRAM